MTTSTLAKYVSFDPTEFQNQRVEEEEKAKSFENLWLKLPNGKTIVRVLPPPLAWSEWFKERNLAISPFLPFHEHFYEQEDGTYVNYICPRKTPVPGQKAPQCPDCTREYLMRTESDDELDRKAAKAIGAKYKLACNVYVRSSTAKDYDQVGKVVPWKMSALSPQHRKKIRDKGEALTIRTMFEKLEARFAASIGKAGKNIVTPGPNGYDIIITKSGEKLNTTYDVDLVDNPCVLHDDVKVMNEILESQPDIRQLIVPATLKEIAELTSRRAEGTAKQVSESTSIDEFVTTTVVTEDDELSF